MTAASQRMPECAEPVFVLCTSRSGSTLLRFVLDAHPDLACPPEMKLPHVLSQLARLWSATDALSGTTAGNGGPVPAISEAVAAGIRHTMDLMIGPYLEQRGKTRYCDKNLGSEAHAETLLAVYPDAKFICLYRHPMDMIASGVEACPWGLNQYGFEPYVTHAPGNSVLALARYWSDHITAILAIEDKYPGRCHRVRYEDLVADPETVAAGIFRFLGLPAAPGVSARAFSRDRERSGPGDFKIWNTSQITDDSVGRGWSVPADLIPGPLTATINGLLDRLGYVPIDASWGTIRKPPDLRLTADGESLEPKSPARSEQVPPGSLLVNERLKAGLRRLGDEFIQEWKPHSDSPFLIVALAPSGSTDVWWLVDLAARKVVRGSGNCDEDRGWTISAPAATWEQVIRDGLNLGVAFRRHGMRYRDRGGGGAGTTGADNRVSMMSDLLGIITWNRARAGRSSPTPSPRRVRDHEADEEPSQVEQPSPVRQQRAIDQWADAEQDDGAAEEELPPRGRDRQPPTNAADLDAALWQKAPADQAPAAPRVTRFTISSAGQAGLPARPGEAPPPARTVKAPAVSPAAPARKPSHAAASSSRAGTKYGRGPSSARERLKMERAQQARRRRGRTAKAWVIVAIAAVVVTIVALHHDGGSGGGSSSGSKVSTTRAGFGYQGPYAPVTLNSDNSVTMAQPGVTEPVVDVYEDFQCSVCRTFEKGSGAAIQRLADEGKVKVVYYPFTMFDSQRQQASSIRAWAAARCVPSSIWAKYHNLLYASQSTQASADGFGVSLLVRLGKTAGITSPSFTQCVQSQQYAVQDVPMSDQLINSGLSGMLTLKLNGQVINPDLSSSQLRRQIISASPQGTAGQAQA